MAGNARITQNNLPRALQYGLDKILDQAGKELKQQIGDRIFEEVKTEKGFYEMMQLAGMGLASLKGEGDAISWDSIDQHWVFRRKVQTYQKSARITMEMLEDNVYEDLLPRIGREQLKGINQARDVNQSAVLNNAFTSGYTYGDGSILCVSTHATQAGGNNSNVLAVAQDLSEVALEDMIILIDNFINDDGLKSEYVPRRLIVPTALRFESKRLLNNPMRPETADRDINVMYADDDIPEIAIWKRLSSDTAFFVQTDAPEGLMTVRRRGIFTKSSQDFETYDTKLTAAERVVHLVGDHRCVVGTPGV